MAGTSASTAIRIMEILLRFKFQFIVPLLISAPFLSRQERCPKEADLRGAELIAPAIKAALLRIFRPALSTPLEHLNLKSVPSKNVPIFARQYGAVQNRFSFRRSSAWSGGRDTQGRALLARSASLVPISLVTFLFGDKKVTEGVRQIPVW